MKFFEENTLRLTDKDFYKIGIQTQESGTDIETVMNTYSIEEGSIAHSNLMSGYTASEIVEATEYE